MTVAGGMACADSFSQAGAWDYAHLNQLDGMALTAGAELGPCGTAFTDHGETGDTP
jgi:hypothetical protein